MELPISAQGIQPGEEKKPQSMPRRGSFQEETACDDSLRKVYSVERLATPAGIVQELSSNAIKTNQAHVDALQPIDIDDDDMLTDHDPGFTKSSSNSRRESLIQSSTADPHIANVRSPASEESIIEVHQSAYQLPPDPSARPNAKLKNKYVMSDGTVVNGKGLGRGRPGIKRGARKSTLSIEATEDNSSGSGSAAAVSTPSPGVKALTDSGKRKRANSDVTFDKEEDNSDAFSRDSTPEYNPTSTQTRSGRQSQRPAPIITPTAAAPTPAPKRPIITHSISSPSIKKHPKIKAKVYRGKEQFALCEHCLRGNGPPGNAIVFCDACNKCWHQRCHDPKIPRHVVADTKAEWFCADCDRILHGKKKNKSVQKAPAQPAIQPVAPVVPPRIALPEKTLTFGPPITAAGNLTLAQQKQYLQSLPKEKLIEIVLKAAELAPLLPIMETPIISRPFILEPQPTQTPLPPPPQPHLHPGLARPSGPPQPVPQFTSTYKTPIDEVPLFSHPTASVPSKPYTANPHADPNDDEGYYDDFDEHGALYPKPGEGAYNLALPPESVDLGMMLEGPDSTAFSHWVKASGTELRKTVENAW